MEKVLSCTGLSKYYGGLPALSDVSVNLFSGRITYLTGSSGSGKSTFLRLAAGLIHPSEGSITVCGIRPGADTNELVAFLPDRDFLPADEKLIDIVRFYSVFFNNYDTDKAAASLHTLNVDLTKRFGDFSRGMRANIQTAIIAARQARVFLLDEPALACDSDSRKYLIEAIFDKTKENAAVIISYPDFLSGPLGCYVDDILMLKNGTVMFCGNVNDYLCGSRYANGEVIEVITE
ncbi:MAG: ATP-binding cassette domain-containing protein [Ruminococcus sp.]|nr:ATP-binding cassette domain-containing protein [Ruminococcus sp.]